MSGYPFEDIKTTCIDMSPSIAILDNATTVYIDALWKINVKECVEASLLSSKGHTEDIGMCYLENDKDDNVLSRMEKGIWVPSPGDLPMPPASWLA